MPKVGKKHYPYTPAGRGRGEGSSAQDGPEGRLHEAGQEGQVMDAEALSIDELDAKSVELKRRIEVLRDERRALKAVRERKVLLRYLADRLGIDVDGITPEQAEKLLEIAGQKPGTVSVTPETATVVLHGHAAGASV